MESKIKRILLWLFAAIAIPANAEDPQPPAPSEPDGIIGGHEYVDLGLPSGTLWATYNVGATSPYEGGDYFAWGEVEPKDDFTWENYKFFEGYEIDPNNGEWAVLEEIANNICGTEYDAARHQWGSGWRLPNDEELYELRMMCWNKYTTENGVRGCRVYGPNEHSIFLAINSVGPLWYGEPDFFDGLDSSFWSGVLVPEFGYNGRPIEPSNRALSILVQTDTNLQTSDCRRASGSNVRAVVNPSEAGVNMTVGDNDGITISYRNGNILVDGVETCCHINLSDLSGRTICSSPVESGIYTPSGLSNGIYLVSVSDGRTILKTQKITIR